MKKVKLTRFIDKFYLNGQINHAAVHSKDEVLSTRFWSGNKLLLGELSMNNWTGEDAVMGIYDTEKLLKLLGILGEDVEFRLKISRDSKSGDEKVISLGLTDGNVGVNYMLAELSIINVPPVLKNIPTEFDVKIKIDKQFITSFIAGKTALGTDIDSFTVLTGDKNVKVVIGYSAINSNRIILPVDAGDYNKIDAISFNADLMKEVLTANKECESATFEISKEGMGRIKFNVDDFSVCYYFVALADID